MPADPHRRPSPASGPPPPAARFASPLRVLGIVACALVLLVAVAGLTGGLEEVPEPELPVAEPEELIEGEPWNVTVIGAVLDTDLPVSLQEETNHWLVVVAEVEVTAPHSMGDPGRVLYLSGMEGLHRESSALIGIPGSQRADDVWIVRDATRADHLHPGLTERLIFVWERTVEAPPLAELEIYLVGLTLRNSSLSGFPEWLDPAPRTRVTTPVHDWREES